VADVRTQNKRFPGPGGLTILAVVDGAACTVATVNVPKIAKVTGLVAWNAAGTSVVTVGLMFAPAPSAFALTRAPVTLMDWPAEQGRSATVTAMVRMFPVVARVRTAVLGAVLLRPVIFS
jgi:hypothetical protein